MRALQPDGQEAPRPIRLRALESAIDDLDQLYNQHFAYVRRAVAHLFGPGAEVDDLVHDVFVQAFRQRAGFQGRSSDRTWLFGIAVRVVANARRRARLRRFLRLDEAPEPMAPDDPGQSSERSQVQAQVYRLLDKLSEKKRTVLILFEMEGIDGEEIARIVDCPVATVWTRLHHGRRELLRLLQKEDLREQQGFSLGRRVR